MAGWSVHEGQAVALSIDNIDTDQLIPARFMSVPRVQGYGDYLLYDMRRDADGLLRPDFVLNAQEEASVLVAGRNFGSGSSREAAVYALLDAGIRAVIAPGFGDIFASNSVNNGLLPARISEADSATLLAHLAQGSAPVKIDLTTCQIITGAGTMAFALEESWRIKLINGWDDIDLTQNHGTEINRFRQARRRVAPWAWPRA